ncbi:MULTISPECIES: hypothetical protein [Clostridium]|uniref:hypothetical protein n=1 Tax=Clostridium TaxID=1485 RepID=UPI00232F4CDF|nr:MULTISPECIES: hypothetical protein [Clostridium]MDB2104824.1 hypothetical protein [Clostridium paraputrificum]MDU2108710.1 hypothetical protein [Clostridium sp.]MDU3355179.1 hypothetical protein [Clostridium sp.]MDU4727963.1 hypothetical protein [Clostridium sp.]
MIEFGMMDWNTFDYNELLKAVITFGGIMLIFISSFRVIFLNRKIKINILDIINVLFNLVISSLYIPFIFVGMIEVSSKTNTDVEKILWLILILFLIKKSYIRIILGMRKVLEILKKKLNAYK